MSIATERASARITPVPSDPIRPALSVLQQGRPVLVVDAADRKNEGYAVIAASLATPVWVAWMVRHTSGLICAPMSVLRTDDLDLPLMVRRNENPRGTAFTVAVDAVAGITTGISASDRARTLRALADPDSQPSDFTRPGHIVPLCALPGGVVERPGHTEAGVDLCRLAGLPPIAAIAAIVGGDGELAPTMADRHELRLLGERFDLPILDIDDLVAYRLRHGDGLLPRVTRGLSAPLPSSHGDLTAIDFHDNQCNAVHIALLGGIFPAKRPVVSVHAKCPAAGLLRTTVCDCRNRLDDGIRRVAADGGVVIRLAQNNWRACGEDTWNSSDRAAVAAILADLGFTSARVLSESDITT